MLDALANREPWAADARTPLFLAACGRLDPYLSGSAITDVFHLVNRHVAHNRRKSPEVVDTLVQSLAVVNVGMRERLLAAHSPITDCGDAVVAGAARSAGPDHIITRNLGDHAGSEVAAISPHDYLPAHVRNYGT